MVVRNAACDAGENCVLGLATGSSPIRVYKELVSLHKQGRLSFCNVVTFNLVGMPNCLIPMYSCALCLLCSQLDHYSEQRRGLLCRMSTVAFMPLICRATTISCMCTSLITSATSPRPTSTSQMALSPKLQTSPGEYFP